MESFLKPTRLEQGFNRLLGFLVRLGLEPGYMVCVAYCGAKTGKRYSTPVNLMVMRGRQYLIAPRGETG